jgi:hypothetical protein
MDVSPPWLLTQTDILRYVYQHPESLKALGIDVNKSIIELQVLLPSSNADSVITASPDELAVDVYKKMGDLKVAGVPIVDEYVLFRHDLVLSTIRYLYHPCVHLETRRLSQTCQLRICPLPI